MKIVLIVILAVHPGYENAQGYVPIGSTGIVSMAAEQDNAPAPQAPIGVCWMEADGTIKMRLRAEGPGGIVGHAMLEYPPDHPEYQEILEHVGPIKPGERKAVQPWPD